MGFYSFIDVSLTAYNISIVAFAVLVTEALFLVSSVMYKDSFFVIEACFCAIGSGMYTV